MCKSNKLAKFRNLHANKQDWRCFYCDFPMWDGDPRLFSERYHLPIGFLDRFRACLRLLQITCNRIEHQREVIAQRLDRLAAQDRELRGVLHRFGDDLLLGPVDELR